MKLKKLIAICVCLLLLVMPAMPQFFFGGGLPVFDSAGLAQALIQSGHLVEGIQQAIKTYNLVRQQYDEMKYQARYIRDMGRFRAAKTIWHEVQAQDWYDRNAPWVRAANTGLGAADAWGRMSRPLSRYPDLSSMSDLIQDLRKDEVGTLQLQDGTAINTLDLVGRVRQAGPQRESVLDQLEMAVVSDDPVMQTEAAQLNKANALLVFLAKSQMDQNRLAANGLEIALLKMKLERDAMVNALNQQTYAQRHTRAFLIDGGPGPSEGLREFRIQ